MHATASASARRPRRSPSWRWSSPASRPSRRSAPSWRWDWRRPRGRRCGWNETFRRPARVRRLPSTFACATSFRRWGRSSSPARSAWRCCPARAPSGWQHCRRRCGATSSGWTGCSTCPPGGSESRWRVPRWASCWIGRGGSPRCWSAREPKARSAGSRCSRRCCRSGPTTSTFPPPSGFPSGWSPLWPRRGCAQSSASGSSRPMARR